MTWCNLDFAHSSRKKNLLPFKCFDVRITQTIELLVVDIMLLFETAHEMLYFSHCQATRAQTATRPSSNCSHTQRMDVDED